MMKKELTKFMYENKSYYEKNYELIYLQLPNLLEFIETETFVTIRMHLEKQQMITYFVIFFEQLEPSDFYNLNKQIVTYVNNQKENTVLALLKLIKFFTFDKTGFRRLFKLFYPMIDEIEHTEVELFLACDKYKIKDLAENIIGKEFVRFY